MRAGRQFRVCEDVLHLNCQQAAILRNLLKRFCKVFLDSGCRGQSTALHAMLQSLEQFQQGVTRRLFLL